MSHSINRSLVCWSLPLLIISSSCWAKPACDSLATRKAVLQYFEGDAQNPLVEYAVKNATSGKEARQAKPKNSAQANTRPLYLLGERIVTASTSRDRLTLKCSGPLSVAVSDIKATKELIFTVQQAKDGKLSVSVEPFQF
jgi:hypothetical protein